jgi:hypothetical protein
MAINKPKKVWRNFWEQDAAGSNPVTRTNFKEKPPISAVFLRLLLGIIKCIPN